ncbi:hypothetical protein [Streptomyces sp. NPDC002889]|uniref:hypothetical protein n=1 Tax=Streptomyces sp. NPDC002889 TaxID=3364669 RepID=UPI0036B908F0
MWVMRKVLLAGSAAVVLMVGSSANAGAGVGAGGDTDDRVIAPESDVAHHGRITLAAGRLGILLVTQNHGPSSLESATVRLVLPERPAGAQVLPAGCLRAGERVVLCATGPLRAGGVGHKVSLDLRTVGTPSEVLVQIDTAWNGGASDLNPENNEHRVLVPATGDPYVF